MRKLEINQSRFYPAAPGIELVTFRSQAVSPVTEAPLRRCTLRRLRFVFTSHCYTLSICKCVKSKFWCLRCWTVWEACHSPSNRAASLSLIISLINNHLLKSSTQTLRSLKTFGTKKNKRKFSSRNFEGKEEGYIQIKMTDDDSWRKSDFVLVI